MTRECRRARVRCKRWRGAREEETLIVMRRGQASEGGGRVHGREIAIGRGGIDIADMITTDRAPDRETGDTDRGAGIAGGTMMGRDKETTAIVVEIVLATGGGEEVPPGLAHHTPDEIAETTKESESCLELSKHEPNLV